MNLSDKSISPASDPNTRRDEVGETGLAALPLRCAERLCLSGPTPTHTCWQGCALPASAYERGVFGKAKPFRTTERQSRKHKTSRLRLSPPNLLAKAKSQSPEGATYISPGRWPWDRSSIP